MTGIDGGNFNFARKWFAISLICVFGLILRIIFGLWFAPAFHNQEIFTASADTMLWVRSIQNFLEMGFYTINPNNEFGFAARMPGYSFFIGIFYLLSGKVLPLTFKLIVWSQIVFDTFAVYLIYQIGLKTFDKSKIALIAAFLYATYPFIIVWNPIVYPETMVVFWIVLSVYFFTRKNFWYKYALTALTVSIAALTKGQAILLIPVYGFLMLLENIKSIRKILVSLTLFSVVVLVVYGVWPARNYINHGKIVFASDYDGLTTLDHDSFAFWKYIFTLKAEWEPQFSQILHNEKVEFPEHAYKVEGDREKLEKVVRLSKTCGPGFSRWREYWKKPIKGDGCKKEIARLYNELRQNQIRHNTLNALLIVPLKNLKKAIFKTQLYDQTSDVKRFAGMLFYYRTLLILLGICGAILMWRSKKIANNFHILCILYFIVWYFMLCFIWRNIEIRYLLPADTLLLIPAAYFLNFAHERLFKKS